MTISRAQVYSSSRSCVLLKLTADKYWFFDWIVGSCQVKYLAGLFKSLLNSNPGLKVNQIITVSSIEILFCSFLFVIISIGNHTTSSTVRD